MEHVIAANSTEFTPSTGNLLVKITLVNEKKSSSGIILNTKKSILDRPCSGEVVASGDPNTAVGTMIMFPNTDGINVEFLDSSDDNKFIVLKKESVIGTFMHKE